jgi:hypothetical protein
MKNFELCYPLSAKTVEADTKRPVTKQPLLSTDRNITYTEGYIEI